MCIPCKTQISSTREREKITKTNFNCDYEIKMLVVNRPDAVKSSVIKTKNKRRCVHVGVCVVVLYIPLILTLLRSNELNQHQHTQPSSHTRVAAWATACLAHHFPQLNPKKTNLHWKWNFMFNRIKLRKQKHVDENFYVWRPKQTFFFKKKNTQHPTQPNIRLQRTSRRHVLKISNSNKHCFHQTEKTHQSRHIIVYLASCDTFFFSAVRMLFDSIPIDCSNKNIVFFFVRIRQQASQITTICIHKSN